MKVFKRIGITLALMVFITGCASAGQAPTENSSKLTIYTTIYPILYAAERIAGDTIDIETVYPPGVDEHSYEPSSKDMTKIAESNAFIYLGAGLEVLAETSAEALSSQDVKLIEIGQNDELFMADAHEDDSEQHTEESEQEHHDHGGVDPHIWLDPIRMIELSRIIHDELIALNPVEKDTYNKNFLVLEKELNELDQRFTDMLEGKENKQILVTHAAFGYWEERYGLEQISINGLSTSSEPSQQDLIEIIDKAEQYDLEYVLYEQNTSNRISKIIQEQIGAEALTIHNLSVLTEDDVESNEDYISLMNYNIKILDKAIK